jgi:cytochrome P450
MLRRVAPVVSFGRTTLITRYADVLEALQRDDFLVAPIYGVKLDATYISSLPGKDRGAEYDRESALLRAVAKREDLVLIRQFVAVRAEEAIARAAKSGRIDLIGDLAHAIPLELAGDYFGLRGPDDASMARWTRDISCDVFYNDTNDQQVHEDAIESARELRDYARAEVARRTESSNDLLGRMLTIRSQPEFAWVDDDVIRRSISHLVVASIDTISMLFAYAFDVLLRRPRELRKAQAAASSGDVDAVGRFIWEAARFKPPTPYVLRSTAAATRIGGRVIPAGNRVALLLASAMFDPTVFYKPAEFRADRETAYLHFGAGMHQCFGAQISRALIPELAAAVLRLPNLRRAGGIVYDGPFPDRFVVLTS